MGKNKLRRFNELHTFSNVIEADFNDVYNKNHPYKGNWNKIFDNDNPIILELGCGKGEYSVDLAIAIPDKNFIGIDIKGNRMWVGARKALDLKLNNVFFIRTRIEFIESFFAPNEVDEIWITFPDPQPQSNRKRKRLTSDVFLNRYRNFLKPQGLIHLKTDSDLLYDYTLNLVRKNNLTVVYSIYDLYSSGKEFLAYNIQTFYEKMFLIENKPIHYLQFKLDGNITTE